jgi:hypothetical protein
VSRDHVLRLGLVAGLAAVALVTAGHLVNVWLFDLEVSALDENASWSVSDFASLVALGAAVAAALALAQTERRGRWLVLAAILIVLLADDATRLHERAGDRWQLLLLPLLVPVVFVLASVDEAGRPAFARTLRAGVALLAVSLFAGYAARPFLAAGDWGPGAWPYEAKVAVKQGAELGGWALVAAGLVALAAAKRATAVFEWMEVES